jgi:metallo-beta-lactamase family protein
MATVISYGAAEVVTGSCHLLELENGKQILIDCGMFQGGEEERNYDAFAFAPSEIDFVLLTHAHLDHCGRIPKLVKEGFEKTIVATRATFELAEVIMLDSAKIMNEDYETRFKKALRRGSEREVRPPLYGEDDVKDALNLTRRMPEYDEPFELCKGVQVTYRDAGHILGSAFIEIRYEEAGQTKTIVFSGDIGNDNDMVLPNLATCPYADYLYVESTYGDRDHQNALQSTNEFKQVIVETLKNWGNVLIPSFAVERTQEILFILKQMHENGELPQCKVFVDSPMAIRATEVYNRNSDLLSEKCRKVKARDGSVFDFELLTYTPDVGESKAINQVDSRAIIIAGSGMCTGGRILHHFKHRLWNRKNALIFVGYQAVGTLGRRIVDGAKWVKIYREDIRIGASVYTINGFSAHADQSNMLEWIEKMKGLQRIFLIHGELDKQEIFKKAIKETLHKEAHIVEANEIIYLN